MFCRGIFVVTVKDNEDNNGAVFQENRVNISLKLQNPIKRFLTF